MEAIARAGEESRGMMGEVQPQVWKRYVTHLVHLEGEGTPAVGREELNTWGVECVRLYGRKMEDGLVTGAGMQYDGKALTQALGAILGKRDPKNSRNRRNTFEK